MATLFRRVVVPRGLEGWKQGVQPRGLSTLVRHGGDYDASAGRQPGAFAVVRFPGTQYKVTKGDVVVADLIKGAVIGSELVFKDVLLVGTVHETLIGRPIVENAKVLFHVEEQTKDEKVIVFKKRDHKSKTRKGFRRDVTLLRVTDIICDSLEIQHIEEDQDPQTLLPGSDDAEDEMDPFDDEDEDEDEYEEDDDALTDEEPERKKQH